MGMVNVPTPTGQNSRPNACQVRSGTAACLARPENEVHLMMPDPTKEAGFDERTYRACSAHTELLRRKYDQLIIAVRPWRHPGKEPRRSIFT